MQKKWEFRLRESWDISAQQKMKIGRPIPKRVMRVRYVNESGIDALAIMVGTAHGKYVKAPELAIDRIKEIHGKTKAYLVLHGGSGAPDEQIKAAINAGIRKINFGTDVCYSFVEGYKKLDPYSAPLDVIMSKASEDVKAFAVEKIKLLGADKF